MTNFTENNLVDAEITEGKRIKMNYICCICKNWSIFGDFGPVMSPSELLIRSTWPVIPDLLSIYPLKDTILIIVYTIFYLVTLVYCSASVLSGSGLFNRRGRGTNPESFKQKVLTVNESVSNISLKPYFQNNP